MICASSEIPQTQRRSFLRPPMQLQPWQAPEMVSLEGVRETEQENLLKCPPLLRETEQQRALLFRETEQ